MFATFFHICFQQYIDLINNLLQRKLTNQLSSYLPNFFHCFNTDSPWTLISELVWGLRHFKMKFSPPPVTLCIVTNCHLVAAFDITASFEEISSFSALVALYRCRGFCILLVFSPPRSVFWISLLGMFGFYFLN